MVKAAVLMLADTETHEDLARMVNGLTAAREFKDAGDDVQIIFDGAATKWPGELADEGHKAHKLYQTVADQVSGACGQCARAFQVEQSVQDAEVDLLKEYHGHPSVRTLVADGYQVLTF